MKFQIEASNLIAFIILRIIWLAVSIWIIKEIIDTFKVEKWVGKKNKIFRFAKKLMKEREWLDGK